MKYSAIAVAIVLCACLLSGNCYKILGIFPSTSDRNYFESYVKLFRELANRNHDVTLISKYALSEPPLTYRSIVLKGNVTLESLSFESAATGSFPRVFMETLVSSKIGNSDCENLVRNNEVLRLLREKSKFDVIVVEQLNSDCGIAVAWKLGAPYVGYSTGALQSWRYARLGISFNPSYSIHHSAAGNAERGFFDRVANFVLYHVGNFIFYTASQVTDHVMLYKYLGNELPSMEKMARNMTLLLSNSFNVIHGSQLRPPHFIEIGGAHLRNPRALPDDIADFITKAEHGVVLVSFGPAMRESTMPKEKLNQLLAVFSSLPLSILWKWDSSSIVSSIPSNVLARKWLPQSDILSHHKVKAFISNAGALSVIEAAYSGIPVIAVPLVDEQFSNAASVRDSGLGVVVYYEDLNRNNLMNALNTVLDPNWQTNAKLIAQKFRDRPTSPLESAIYWVEYVAKYGGAQHLKAPSVDAPLYLHYQLDTLVFISVAMLIIIYLSYNILWFVWFVLCCCRTRVEENDTHYKFD